MSIQQDILKIYISSTVGQRVVGVNPVHQTLRPGKSGNTFEKLKHCVGNTNIGGYLSP
jgi:hypothetical protein